MKGIDLLDCCVHYIKARDAIERKLKSLDQQKDRVVARYKDKEVTFLGEEKLSTAAASMQGFVTVLTVQNQENFNTLVAEFSTFHKNPGLTIIFLNPVLNEKWLIKPAVHASVADKTSLKLGLQAMYDTVPAV
jgi:hypothetical protein